jgi:hypothetical protein
MIRFAVSRSQIAKRRDFVEPCAKRAELLRAGEVVIDALLGISRPRSVRRAAGDAGDDTSSEG